MRVGSTATSTKPTSVRRRWYSFSSSAPATHPTHSSMLRRTAGGSSPRTTTSDTANRPPGLSTRNASRSTRRLSAERLTTQFEMITSTDASGRGICSISPFRNSTFTTPALRWFSRARASIDRKSTRLNSSHSQISYAVFCLKKKKYKYDDGLRPASRDFPFLDREQWLRLVIPCGPQHEPRGDRARRRLDSQRARRHGP